MKILLDTHILIWALADSPELSGQARKILSCANEVFFSPVSLWEIEIKRNLHPDEFDFSAENIYKFCSIAGYRQLFFKAEDTFLLSSLRRKPDSPAHKDPFDRILLCQARANDLQIVTHDRRLTEYNFENVLLV